MIMDISITNRGLLLSGIDKLTFLPWASITNIVAQKNALIVQNGINIYTVDFFNTNETAVNFLLKIATNENSSN